MCPLARASTRVSCETRRIRNFPVPLKAPARVGGCFSLCPLGASLFARPLAGALI